MDNGLHAKLARLRCVQDFFDLRSVGKTHWCTGGEHRQLPSQIAGNRHFVLNEQSLELAHVLKRLAARQLPGRIDRQSVMKCERLSIHAEALCRGDFIGHGSVAPAKRAHDVETLQCEAWWVHLA